jgi:hypothetical protein
VCPAILESPTFFAVLLHIDEAARAEGRPVCGGVLHRADYPRKPRGLIPGSWLAITQAGVPPARTRGLARAHCSRNPPESTYPFLRIRLRRLPLWSTRSPHQHKADFAPTNAAFAALPHGVLDGLRVDSDARTEVLT